MLEPAHLVRMTLRAIEEARQHKDLVPLLLIAGALAALNDRVRKVIVERMGCEPPPLAIAPPAGDRWIPLAAAARQLGWSMKTLRRRDRERPLPFIIRRPGEKPCASEMLLQDFMARERRRVREG